MPKQLYKNIPPYGEDGEVDLVALVSCSDLQDTKKRRELKRGRPPIGKPCGLITPVKRSLSWHGHHCLCECGRKVRLTTDEIKERYYLGAGCLHADCHANGQEMKAWHNPEYALLLQWQYLLKHSPALVDNAWGGSAYDCAPAATGKEGLAQFLLDALPRVVGKSWWLSRGNPVLPYSAFSLTLVSSPEIDLFGPGSRYVMSDKGLVSVDDLAERYRLPLNMVRSLRRSTLNNAHIMQQLQKESGRQ